MSPSQRRNQSTMLLPWLVVVHVVAGQPRCLGGVQPAPGISIAHFCALLRRTTLWSQCCGERPTPLWPLLVTGTPRSGTVYALEVLIASGLNMSSDWQAQGPKKDGAVSWIHWVAAKRYFGPEQLPTAGKFRAVAHIVREPLRSITSIGCTEPVMSAAWSSYVRQYIRWPFPRKTCRACKRNGTERLLRGLTMYVGWQEGLVNLMNACVRLSCVGPPLASGRLRL